MIWHIISMSSFFISHCAGHEINELLYYMVCDYLFLI
jgi:hypothetical protein